MSVYSYTTIIADKHVIPSDKITSFLQDETFDTKDLKGEVEGEQFGYGLKPVVVANTSKRTSEAQLRAIKNYRKNHREKYNEYQNKLYNKYKEDDNWKVKYNEKQKQVNKEYRQKQRQKEIEQLMLSGKIKSWTDLRTNKVRNKLITEFKDYISSIIGEKTKIGGEIEVKRPRGRPKKVKEIDPKVYTNEI
jgi:hypothetical protein